MSHRTQFGHTRPPIRQPFRGDVDVGRDTGDHPKPKENRHYRGANHLKRGRRKFINLRKNQRNPLTSDNVAFPLSVYDTPSPLICRQMRGRPVSRILFGSHASLMAIPLRHSLPSASSCQPSPSWRKPSLAAGSGCPMSHPHGGSIRHCSRWGLPCRPRCRGRGGLLPHRFTLTAPCTAVFSLWRFPSGCPARELPGTVVSWSPDFPRAPRRTQPSSLPRNPTVSLYTSRKSSGFRQGRKQSHILLCHRTATPRRITVTHRSQYSLTGSRCGIPGESCQDAEFPFAQPCGNRGGSRQPLPGESRPVKPRARINLASRRHFSVSDHAVSRNTPPFHDPGQ